MADSENRLLVLFRLYNSLISHHIQQCLPSDFQGLSSPLKMFRCAHPSDNRFSSPEHYQPIRVAMSRIWCYCLSLQKHLCSTLSTRYIIYSEGSASKCNVYIVGILPPFAYILYNKKRTNAYIIVLRGGKTLFRRCRKSLVERGALHPKNGETLTDVAVRLSPLLRYKKRGLSVALKWPCKTTLIR